ncbi:DUF1835 domain-containing protein [Lysinibacillus parviboronicapiens]|uniref:DUF1835 domain-containing protein n=1 Tax=Lysinibacillus parviboronicapiens TaxID=436516 RepID=UPI000D3468F0|nr:DUF1835 domain-containing protein [Lysinibacillus parviboronicapiens]
MEKITQLKQAIQRLNEADAKSMLLLLLVNSSLNEEKLQDIRQSILKFGDKPKTRDVQTMHIVFGESPAGSLKAAFRNTDYTNTEDIIMLPTNFSIGPLKDLHKVSGIEARFEWFQERYNSEDDGLQLYKSSMFDIVEKIKNIPPHQHIVIWTCQNAHEQTGLRLVLAMLENKLNPVFVLDTYTAFHEIYTLPHLAEDNYPRSSGEVSSEDLLSFYEQYDLRPLQQAKRQILCAEGLRMLADDDYLIRSWEHHELWQNTNEDCDDAFIIACAKRLEKEEGNKKFRKSARLIGEVMGHMEQYRGDEWIEYRLRCLIKQGVFMHKGDLKAMRYYEVRLPDAT